VSDWGEQRRALFANATAETLGVALKRVNVIEVVPASVRVSFEVTQVAGEYVAPVSIRGQLEDPSSTTVATLLSAIEAATDLQPIGGSLVLTPVPTPTPTPEGESEGAADGGGGGDDDSGAERTQPTSNSPLSSSNGGLSRTAIIAIATAGGVALCVLLFALGCACKHAHSHGRLEIFDVRRKSSASTAATRNGLSSGGIPTGQVIPRGRSTGEAREPQPAPRLSTELSTATVPRPPAPGPAERTSRGWSRTSTREEPAPGPAGRTSRGWSRTSTREEPRPSTTHGQPSSGSTRPARTQSATPADRSIVVPTSRQGQSHQSYV